MYIPSFNEIKGNVKSAFQRAFRGYDDRIRYGWGLEYYFVQIIPEIKWFCEQELEEYKENNIYENNPRTEVFKTTLKLIKDYSSMTNKDEFRNENQLNFLFKHISKHLGWYWN